MHAPYTPHPYIVFVDEDGQRLDQVDLWAVDAPSYHEAMVAAADNVQLYVDGALKVFSVEVEAKKKMADEHDLFFIQKQSSRWLSHEDPFMPSKKFKLDWKHGSGS